MKLRVFLILCCATLIISCERESSVPVSVPIVDIDCQHANCNNTFNLKTAVVILTRSGCANADFDPVASGSTTVTCTVNGCSGSIGSWADANNNSVTEILPGVHQICAVINQSGADYSKDPNDMVSESEENIFSSAAIRLDTWTVEP